MKKLDYIDALRGVAILSVIWFHCHLHHYSHPAYFSLMDTLGSPAAMGVQLFYVLSAFTLFLSQSRHSNSNDETANFFVRRFFRIAPMYYVAMLYYLWQMTYSEGKPFGAIVASNLYGIVANTLLVHGLSPVWINSIIPGGWSVGIEVLFYAMVPYLFTRITTLNRAIIFTAGTMLFGFVLTSILSQFPVTQSNQLVTDYLFFYIPYQLPVFGCGIVAYYVVIRKERNVSLLAVSIAVSALIFILLSKTLGKSVAPNLPHTLHLFGSIGFALLIIILANIGTGGRMLVNGVTRYIGKISYSAYLTHFGLLYWMDKVMPPEIITVHNVLTNIVNFHLKFLLIVLLTAIVSTITYRLIEEPAQQFGKRFLRKRTDQVLESI